MIRVRHNDDRSLCTGIGVDTASGSAWFGTFDIRRQMTLTAAKKVEDEASRPLGGVGAPAAVRTLVLARLAAVDGATRAELVRDLSIYLSHRLTPGEARELLQDVGTGLASSGAAVETRGRLTLTPAGRTALVETFGSVPLPKDWAQIRDGHLVAAALGLEQRSAPRLRALSRPDGLRAAILTKTYDLSDKLRSSPSSLRAQLAVVALERAFGNKIKSGVGSGKDLPAKAARLLASQLCHRPRDLGTDSRLVATLAAEAVGSAQPGADQLRIALLRRWLSASFDAVVGSQPARGTEPSVAPVAPPLSSHVALKPPRPQAASRPDLVGFAAAVQSAARRQADGWPGNRKALISRLYPVIDLAHPEWGITEVEFKTMLAEAHRTGHLVLVTADLKDKSNLKELQQSAVAYKNTVWHLVRVEE